VIAALVGVRLAIMLGALLAFLGGVAVLVGLVLAGRVNILPRRSAGPTMSSGVGPVVKRAAL